MIIILPMNMSNVGVSLEIGHEKPADSNEASQDYENPKIWNVILQ